MGEEKRELIFSVLTMKANNVSIRNEIISVIYRNVFKIPKETAPRKESGCLWEIGLE